ncbi:MAG: hypothetical protein ACJAYB_000009 [Psychromonas sp.]|jgi:hypothetical protein
MASRFHAQLTGNINREVRKMALQLLTEFTIVSPVDTGRFRGNWYVGMDNRVTKTDHNRRAPQAISEAQAILLGGSVLGDDFDSIYITNNLDYGPKLNDGHSLQAPARFVQIAIARIVNAR